MVQGYGDRYLNTRTCMVGKVGKGKVVTFNGIRGSHVRDGNLRSEVEAKLVTQRGS